MSSTGRDIRGGRADRRRPGDVPTGDVRGATDRAGHPGWMGRFRNPVEKFIRPACGRTLGSAPHGQEHSGRPPRGFPSGVDPPEVVRHGDPDTARIPVVHPPSGSARSRSFLTGSAPLTRRPDENILLLHENVLLLTKKARRRIRESPHIRGSAGGPGRAAATQGGTRPEDPRGQRPRAGRPRRDHAPRPHRATAPGRRALFRQAGSAVRRRQSTARIVSTGMPHPRGT